MLKIRIYMYNNRILSALLIQNGEITDITYKYHVKHYKWIHYPSIMSAILVKEIGIENIPYNVLVEVLYPDRKLERYGWKHLILLALGYTELTHTIRKIEDTLSSVFLFGGNQFGLRYDSVAYLSSKLLDILFHDADLYDVIKQAILYHISLVRETYLYGIQMLNVIRNAVEILEETLAEKLGRETISAITKYKSDIGKTLDEEYNKELPIIKHTLILFMGGFNRPKKPEYLSKIYRRVINDIKRFKDKTLGLRDESIDTAQKTVKEITKALEVKQVFNQLFREIIY